MLGSHYTICKDYLFATGAGAGFSSASGSSASGSSAVTAGSLAAVSLGSLIFAYPLAAGSLLACSAVFAALAGSLHLILYAEIFS